MNQAQLRQSFYAQLSPIYFQGELQSLYHWCVAEVHGWSRAEAYLQNDTILTLDELSQWQEIIIRLKKKEPIQYIFNKSIFHGLSFRSDERALIPRPETEELVELVLQRESGSELRVVDVGTGSGCIAIALKNARDKWHVSGIDISKEALSLAKTNAEHIGADVNFSFGDALKASDFPHADVVVSNPPYIPSELMDTLDDQVVKYEPKLALFSATEDPFEFFTAITRGAQLGNVKRVYFETHGTDIQLLTDSLRAIWSGDLEVVQDMSNKPRFVILK